MTRYYIEPRTRKYVKEHEFLSITKRTKLLDKALDALKKVVHKEGEYLRHKIADAITKLNDDNTEKHEPVEEIIIPAEKREGIINKLRKVL